MKRIRIVIDTNIFISAFLGSRNSKNLIQKLIDEEFELILSQEQLGEIEEVLERPKLSRYFQEAETAELIALLMMKCVVPAKYEPIHDCRDPKDNMILEAAIYGNAEYIITGDKDLLSLDPYRWLRIVTLEWFLREGCS